MLLSNLETIPNRRIVKHLGLVQGSTVRAKHVGRDFMAGLKNLVGGELKGYTELLNESRDQALDRMMEQARQAGANTVLNVRFSTSSVAAGAAEIFAYGNSRGAGIEAQNGCFNRSCIHRHHAAYRLFHGQPQRKKALRQHPCA